MLVVDIDMKNICLDCGASDNDECKIKYFGFEEYFGCENCGKE
jgi:hypothetical protein